MATELIVNNSQVEDRRPTPAQFTARGELSLNNNEEGPFLCCKDTAGNVQQLAGVKISDAEPGQPLPKTLWVQPITPTSGKLFIYNGANWLFLGSVSNTPSGSGVEQVIGGDGVNVAPSTGVGVVTLTANVDTDKGLAVLNKKLAVTLGVGLSFNEDGEISLGDVTAEQIQYAYPATGGVERTVQDRLEDYVSVKDFMDEDEEDDTIAFNKAIDASLDIWIPPNTTVKCLGDVYPRSGSRIHGVRGSSVVEQYGSNLFVANGTLLNCEISGLDLVYKNPSPDVRHCAFKLQAHHTCNFEKINFTGYGDVTIFERLCQANDTKNCTFNKYADFEVYGCNTLDFAAGYEQLQYIHIGDGETTFIDTGTEWPEQFPSSVVILKEDNRRILTELTFGSDYTVSYPSGILQITLTSPASSDERIWIYPACPVSSNRRPISNNSWENCKSRFVKSRGHTAVRWLDAENYTDEHLQMHQNNAVAYDLNPYKTRGGQGGDYNSYAESVLSYSGAVTDPDTLLAWRLGPGSFNIMGSALKLELGWANESLNRSLAIKDISLDFYELPGTVSITTGSKIVTGANTVFTQKLSVMGATRDIVRIEGRDYGIASIDSDTQITLATNAKATLSEVKIYRFNPGDNTGYYFTFSDMSLERNNKRESPTGGGTAQSHNRTLDYGTITIPEGETSVTIDHAVWREFKAFEIRLTPESQLDGRSLSVNSITKDTFTVDVDTAGASCTIGYVIQLIPLNLPES